MNRAAAVCLGLALAGAACSAAAAREAPQIRVGLAVDAAVAVVGTTEGPLLVAERDGSGALGTFRELSPPLRLGVRPATAAPAGPSEWTVLVRGVGEDADAERLRQGLERALSHPMRVDTRGGRRVVAVGPFSSEEPAEAIASRLRAAGVGQVDVEETLGEPTAVAARLAAVTPAFDVVTWPAPSVTIRTAAPGAFLTLDGRPHRGDLEAILTRAAALNVVVVLELEDYLRGVVPEELGPAVYPEPEALAAQAVAARTYAVRQVASGRHAGEGYDLCPTASCQVYGGVESEHPLSDRAVAATANLVLAWEGEPARTFFSSTCGGSTEAVERVFTEQPPLPYLRPASCFPDVVGFSTLDGRAAPADFRLSDGRPADELLARLLAAGVLSLEEVRAKGFSRRARGDESAVWTRLAASAAGWPLAATAMDGEADVGSAMAWLAWLERALTWRERRDFVGAADRAAAARFRALEGLDRDGVLVALLALQDGVLPAGLEPGWAHERPTRGFVLETLGRWISSRGVLDTKPLRVVGPAESGGLRVHDGESTRVLRVGADTLLLSGPKDGPFLARGSVDVKLADKLRAWPAGAGEPRVVLLEEDPDGAAYDRVSALSWWSRSVPFSEVARRAAARGVADLVDLSVESRGASGRIVALRLVDRRGRSTVVEGFAARGILGLPDLLAELTLERDASGRPVALVAVGRGWGHGVGLCQTGAFGMARAGIGYAEILGHYYRGAELARLADLD